MGDRPGVTGEMPQLHAGKEPFGGTFLICLQYEEHAPHSSAAGLVWGTLRSGLQTDNTPSLWCRQSSTSWMHSNFENVLTDFPEEMHKSLFRSLPTQNKHSTLNEGKHNPWPSGCFRLPPLQQQIIFKLTPPKNWRPPSCTKHSSLILLLDSRIKCGVMISCILGEKSPVSIPKQPNFLRKMLKIASLSLKILYCFCTNKANCTCHTVLFQILICREMMFP